MGGFFVTDTKHLLTDVLEAIKDKKAFDLKALDIKEISSITDYFVICSANNERQVQAVCDEIEYKIKNKGIEISNIEGYRNARWILVDLGDIVVHIFHKEEREFYNLDRLWIDATNLEVDN